MSRAPRSRRLAVSTAVPATAVAGLLIGASTWPNAAAADPVRWQASWGAAPQMPSTGFTPNWSQAGFSHQTVRQVVRISEGGDRLRIRLSNAYGTSPVEISGATVARTAEGASVVPGTVRPLTFGGHRSAAIPAHGDLRSDAAGLAADDLTSVTVTLYLAGTTGPATFHAQGFATSYLADGDHRADASGAAFAETSQSWYYLSGVEVGRDRRDRHGGDGIVALGDSLTDGFGSTPGADNRYPDELAELTGRPVVNSGIGGNLVLNDSAWYGERGTARFARDVLDQPGVSTVVLLEGVNDIGFSEVEDQPTYRPAPEISADELIAGYRTLIRRAHQVGLEIVGATLPPFQGSDHWGPHAARVGDEVNDWIRNSGEFDAVVDLDRVLADPADPDRLNPAYDSSDGLHPNDAGYRLTAEAVAAVL
ncbi:SGNH/GDSL hydrolase family protein [Streptomyces hoynatensis]|uniref:SGNH/GDSL hydrolase family protein n=1 Tax=Streptomyces hoynatensis TaxID=1141874 RepID=A0A3A9ZCC7_9ACTN|nr:SGNH/GDSL hydrolase family protein [Streptomyces hoynatensis]RKN45769.1 SGNH/GDSL hydrolase family protein [Streptomyces hoynatensis]